jgi:hypothetical protein
MNLDYIELPQEPKFLFTFGNIDPSAQIDYIISVFDTIPQLDKIWKHENNTYQLPQ